MVVFGAVGWADDRLKSVIKTMQAYLRKSSLISVACSGGIALYVIAKSSR